MRQNTNIQTLKFLLYRSNTQSVDRGHLILCHWLFGYITTLYQIPKL